MVKIHRDTNTTGHKRYTLSCSSRAVTEEYIRKYIVKIRYFKPVSGVTTSWPCARWFWKNDRKYSYLNSYYLYVTCNHFDSKRHSSDYFLTKPFILTTPPPSYATETSHLPFENRWLFAIHSMEHFQWKWKMVMNLPVLCITDKFEYWSAVASLLSNRILCLVH